MIQWVIVWLHKPDRAEGIRFAEQIPGAVYPLLIALDRSNNKEEGGKKS